MSALTFTLVFILATALIFGVGYVLGRVDGYEAHRRDAREEYEDHLYNRD